MVVKSSPSNTSARVATSTSMRSMFTRQCMQSAAWNSSTVKPRASQGFDLKKQLIASMACSIDLSVGTASTMDRSMGTISSSNRPKGSASMLGRSAGTASAKNLSVSTASAVDRSIGTASTMDHSKGSAFSMIRSTDSASDEHVVEHVAEEHAKVEIAKEHEALGVAMVPVEGRVEREDKNETAEQVASAMDLSMGTASAMDRSAGTASARDRSMGSASSMTRSKGSASDEHVDERVAEVNVKVDVAEEHVTVGFGRHACFKVGLQVLHRLRGPQFVVPQEQHTVLQD
mmetsp:Transcript_62204/g.157127  ORF Transcript_62204/g.157127 Transcript_62204/m.157127 type:complete len:288 (+) Transcript_62204:285-1148(+)